MLVLRGAAHCRTAVLAVALLATAALTTASCALVPCSQFAMSLASDRGGAASPLAAARAFVDAGTEGGLPGSGWAEDHRDGNGVTLRSGSATLHAIQGSDGTWLIDSGGSC